MAKPKWLMKPVDMYKTAFGFRFDGPGVIYNYKKTSNGLSDTKVFCFVIARNRQTGKEFILFDSNYMNMQSIRRNIEVNKDFSSMFKKTMFRILFRNESSHDVKNIKKALEIINKVNG